MMLTMNGKTNLNLHFLKLPTPLNISYFWNFGSLLGVSLALQIVTGLFLVMYYIPNAELAFTSVIHLIQDVNFGWFLQLSHANGASLFFILMYLHMIRGLYFKSYRLMEPWSVGVTILLVSMGVAFMGYVLPWGQMSFWGATVITGLLSTVPYVGEFLTQWLWGGLSVDSPTLGRFLAFHFILPLVILGLVMIHIFYLHNSGSSNPLVEGSNKSKLLFQPFFVMKDFMGFSLVLILGTFVVSNHPEMFMDPENFNFADSSKTPPHIQPEWYFLFAYAILRSIPNKLGGVVALALSVLVFYLLPWVSSLSLSSFTTKLFFYMFLTTIILLTWIGSLPVEEPYITIGQIFTFLYFFILFAPFSVKLWSLLSKLQT